MKAKEQRLEFFQNLADDLADHVSELSDSQILGSVKEQNINPGERASYLKGKISSFVMESRRERKLRPSQEKYSCIAENSSFREKFFGRSINELKATILKHIPKSDALPDGLVFAGRNLDELTESDLLNVLEDMRDLGLIDDE